MAFTEKNVRIMPNKEKSWGTEKEKGLLRMPKSVIKVTDQYKAFTENHPEMLI